MSRDKKKNESEKAKALRAEIKALEESIEEKRRLVREYQQQLADEIAEFKIGDLVTYTGNDAVVTRVYFSYGNVRYKIRLVKKNGELYKDEREAWSDEKLVARKEAGRFEESLDRFNNRMKREKEADSE